MPNTFFISSAFQNRNSLFGQEARRLFETPTAAPVPNPKDFAEKFEKTVEGEKSNLDGKLDTKIGNIDVAVGGKIQRDKLQDATQTIRTSARTQLVRAMETLYPASQGKAGQGNTEVQARAFSVLDAIDREAQSLLDRGAEPVDMNAYFNEYMGIFQKYDTATTKNTGEKLGALNPETNIAILTGNADVQSFLNANKIELEKGKGGLTDEVLKGNNESVSIKLPNGKSLVFGRGLVSIKPIYSGVNSNTPASSTPGAPAPKKEVIGLAVIDADGDGMVLEKNGNNVIVAHRVDQQTLLNGGNALFVDSSVQGDLTGKLSTYGFDAGKISFTTPPAPEAPKAPEQGQQEIIEIKDAQAFTPSTPALMPEAEMKTLGIPESMYGFIQSVHGRRYNSKESACGDCMKIPLELAKNIDGANTTAKTFEQFMKDPQYQKDNKIDYGHFFRDKLPGKTDGQRDLSQTVGFKELGGLMKDPTKMYLVGIEDNRDKDKGGGNGHGLLAIGGTDAIINSAPNNFYYNGKYYPLSEAMEYQKAIGEKEVNGEQVKNARNAKMVEDATTGNWRLERVDKNKPMMLTMPGKTFKIDCDSIPIGYTIVQSLQGYIKANPSYAQKDTAKVYVAPFASYPAKKE